MKKICAFGPVDKRVLVYPLIKLLDLLGKTLVVTDDANFRKFGDSFELEFTHSRIDMFIMPVVTEEAMLEKGIVESNYDNALYITTTEIVSECDSYIYCHGLNKSMCSEEIVDGIDEIPCTEVIITPFKIPQSKEPSTQKTPTLKLDVGKETLNYVFYCEENKAFMPAKSIAVQNTLAKACEASLGLTAENIGKMMAREE